jgi:two-component system, OmpR family, sensor kinase
MTTTRPARWRSPAGWPLRTRIVALLIVLLALLGVVVGSVAEVCLRNQLYAQVDTQLKALGDRGHFNGRNDDDGPRVPPGAQQDWIIARTDAGGVFTAGRVTYPNSTSSDPFNASFSPVPASVATELAALPLNKSITDITLDALGDYRVIAQRNPDGGTFIAAIPLKDTQAILLQVAGVTGGAVLLTVLVAGFAGALIVRRNLAPLDRVAATATRVSELRLDRGEVDLAQRVPERDTDPRTEVGQVGAALNQLLDHVGNALEARHASEMQVRQFVADASHELRTPLAAIRGYAELSRRSRQPVPEEVSHVLSRVESEAKRMTVLVEDLLLLARLDAGRPLAHDPVDLSMLVVDAVSDAHAAGPRHDWQLDLPEEPVTVIGDGARLHQVLANLLANARTHTPEGTSVTVGVGTADGAAVLRVTDAGPGIPSELQAHIFERFARGDSSRSRAAGSTGLGLSIVHAVVTAHRGTVSVTSEPGRTAFTVLLPLVPPALVPPSEQLARTAPQPG